MCGHFGFITKKETLSERQRNKRNNVIKALSFAMQERGTDSTGIAVVKDEVVKTIKNTGNAYDFMSNGKVKKNLEPADIVLGHTRFATRGAISKDNAHPYTIGNIVGCHNGVIDNDIDHGKFEVDSMAVFHLLNENNNDYTKVFPQIEGSCTLSWLDLRNSESINFVSHENPLCFVRIDSLNTLFYASTKETIQSVLMASGLLKGAKIWTPYEDIVYTIDRNLDIQKQKVSFKKRKPIIYPAYGGTYSRYLGDTDDYSMENYKTIDDDTILYDELVEFEAMDWQVRNGGCCFCDKVFDVKKSKGYYWNFNDYQVACRSCGSTKGYCLNEMDWLFVTYKQYRKNKKYYIDQKWKENNQKSEEQKLITESSTVH